MDLPQVLHKLGFDKTTTNGGPFWGGPGATSFCTWEQMSGKWPECNQPLSGKAVFEAAWNEIVAEKEANEYQNLRKTLSVVDVSDKSWKHVSGYALIPDQLDMLYWDIASGVFGEQAKQSAWFQDCSGVKAAFPKPS